MAGFYPIHHTLSRTLLLGEKSQAFSNQLQAPKRVNAHDLYHEVWKQCSADIICISIYTKYCIDIKDEILRGREVGEEQEMIGCESTLLSLLRIL